MEAGGTGLNGVLAVSHAVVRRLTEQEHATPQLPSMEALNVLGLLLKLSWNVFQSAQVYVILLISLPSSSGNL